MWEEYQEHELHGRVVCSIRVGGPESAGGRGQQHAGGWLRKGGARALGMGSGRQGLVTGQRKPEVERGEEGVAMVLVVIS